MKKCGREKPYVAEFSFTASETDKVCYIDVRISSLDSFSYSRRFFCGCFVIISIQGNLIKSLFSV